MQRETYVYTTLPYLHTPPETCLTLDPLPETRSRLFYAIPLLLYMVWPNPFLRQSTVIIIIILTLKCKDHLS